MSQLNSVVTYLKQRFEDQRLVFWHDTEDAYSAEINALNIPGVVLVRVDNNEYALKYRILREEPSTKFLVYRSGPMVADEDNWLLDLELAYGVFTADRTALLRQDLGLTGEGVADVLRTHDTFFRATRRVDALRRLLRTDDDADRLRAKMSAVLLGQQEHSLLELTRTLVLEEATGGSTKYEALVEHGLDDFHWNRTARIYGYTSEQPSVYDFILWMFDRAVKGFAATQPDRFRNIQLDFGNLRNDLRSAGAMMTLADRVVKDRSYTDKLEDASLKNLAGNDLFREVEMKVISLLIQGILDRSMNAHEVVETIRSRQTSIWRGHYRAFYDALEAATLFFQEISTVRFDMSSFDDGLEKYRDQWFRIDQLYRHFRFALPVSDSRPLAQLSTEVEKQYTNKFLYELGAAWQNQVDDIDHWRSMSLYPQLKFYKYYVEPVVNKGTKKAVVIISDALRYEIAEELGTRIRQEDRFDAELDAMLGVLPSYTQLGMAALLPHEKLGHSPNGDPVLVDGQGSRGTANRAKILATVDGHAITARDVFEMGPDKRRELYSQHQVLYIYHDFVDAIGDKYITERQTFQAVDRTLDELVDLIKKMTNANATNVFVTADHGFLYQDTPLADSFYLSETPAGDEITVIDRRYVLGRGLKDHSGFRTFQPEQLDLDSDLEVQIPNSIHRIKRPGAGTRFVHGGASLQEIVIPVLTVHKKRRSDIRAVNVDVIPTTDRITTSLLPVQLYQSGPVTDKVHPRRLRASLYVGEQLISNEVELTFNQTSEDKRDRYQSIELLLSKEADGFNNRTVELRLDEPIPNTTKWRRYKTASYTLRRSFTADFDF